MIDKRAQGTNWQTEKLSEGVANLSSDVNYEDRFRQNELERRRYSLYRGSVVMALPQLGFHVVAIEGLQGLVKASVAGQVDDWGVQETRAIQNGTSVLIAIQPKSQRASIVGNMPLEDSVPEDEFTFPSFAGSWSGLARDPAADQFVTLTKADGLVRAYHINPLWDQHGGDWGIRTNLGQQILVDSFAITLACDEVTRVQLDLLEQAVIVEGRRVSVQGDGFSLRDSVKGDFATFAMGQSAWQAGSDLTLSDSRPDKAYQQTLAGWMLDYDEVTSEDRVEQLGSLGYAMQSICAFGNLGETNYGMSRSMVSPRGYHTISGKRAGLVSAVPGFYEYREPLPIAEEPEDTDVQTAAKTGYEQLESFQGDRPPHLFGLEALIEQFRVDTTSLGLYGRVQQLAIKSNEQWLGDGNTKPEGETTRKEAVDEHEAYIELRHWDESNSPAYAPMVSSDQYFLSGVFVDSQTGDISLINEQGAGIRIVGSTVFIEGLQVRIAASRDVVLLGRDVQILANRNVTATAKDNLRFYSDKNVAILSGNSGRGGMLLESRGSNREAELTDDPDEVLYSGIAMKSIRSQISLLGGNVSIKAGQTQGNIGGQLTLLSETGPIFMSSGSTFIRHSRGIMVDLFGPNVSSPTGANTYTPSLSTFSGPVFASSLWASRDVVAGSNIQAISGRVADSIGGQMGRVLPESRQQTQRTIQQIRNSSAEMQRNASEIYKTLRETQFAEQGPLNPSTVLELSSGFVRESSNEASGYNVRSLITSVPYEFRQSLDGVSLEDFAPMEVVYKKDASSKSTKTYAWPGKNATVYRAREDGDSRIGPLLASWAAGGSSTIASTSPKAVTPAKMFATVRSGE